MKVLYVMTAVTLLLSICSTAGESEDENTGAEEELPKPEGQRAPYRNSYRVGSSSRFRAGGGGGGGGYRNTYNSASPSYDPSEVYKSMTTNLDNHKFDSNSLNSNAPNRAGYAGNSNSKYSSSSSELNSYSRDDYGYDDLRSKGNYGGYSAASDYGSYASESGYGLSCASGYVNASAVALLAFLFLLNIVQDVIQSITGMRRRRDVAEGAPASDVFQFISDGGVDALKEGLPQIIIPLMVELVEASEAPECLQRPLCRVNADLVMEYGVVGRVVGSLFSNVMAKAFTGDHVRHFHLALDAAKLGRQSGDCGAYTACNGAAHKYAQELNKDIDIDNVTVEAQKSDVIEGLGEEIWSSHLELDNKLD